MTIPIVEPSHSRTPATDEGSAPSHLSKSCSTRHLKSTLGNLMLKETQKASCESKAMTRHGDI